MKRAKSILYVLMAALVIPFHSFSQEKVSSFSSLLSKYYDVKNALVAGDATGAAKAAGDFLTFTKTIDAKTLPANEQTAFKSVQAKLLADASSISGSKDLAKQRSAFQTLSESVITLAKASKPAKPAYIAYCPMKKAYWISAEQGIKNPYYGSSMLTCGKLTDSLK
jgi:hypothetical protein